MGASCNPYNFIYRLISMTQQNYLVLWLWSLGTSLSRRQQFSLGIHTSHPGMCCWFFGENPLQGAGPTYETRLSPTQQTSDQFCWGQAVSQILNQKKMTFNVLLLLAIQAPLGTPKNVSFQHTIQKLSLREN